FCNKIINFIIKQDKDKIFRFASLQSEAGGRLLELHHLNKENFNSFILVEDGKVYSKSTGALKIFNKLSYWRWTKIFWIVPSFLRNAIYDFIANNRYKWFGKKEACMVPTADVKMRFLN
ncbi:MAG TPA: DCC1-like thiol-disulfide oxidoreductase family protein, partial [Flavisolibacter sp.]|nr:DCC1-like thiol-disulfide oxidoreductase family protein [Flavisolibacter sp.]